MTAVTERPAKVRVIREPAATEPSAKEYTASAIKLAFGQIEALLCAAHATGESHEWSGDSCRLLRIAHGLAAQASKHPPAGHEIDQAAFDIAALIRAARIVPGDSESPERKVLVDQAAVHLNWLTECDVSGRDCCDPGVPRPAAPNAMEPSQPDDIGETECIELARQAVYEIQKLAETTQMVVDQLGSEEDRPIVFGLMARIRVLTNVAFQAAALHGDGRAESESLTELQSAFKGGL
jgi:hypothetical protein